MKATGEIEEKKSINHLIKKYKIPRNKSTKGAKGRTQKTVRYWGKKLKITQMDGDTYTFLAWKN